ncbi:MAG: hypothetical protein JWP31_1855 [Aeromicrobium sp.]|nr:hypothetical protein [Aeromicrobium sp.]
MLVAAEQTHRLDDLADAVGLDPKPRPDPADDRLIAAAAAAQSVVLATVTATARRHAGLDLARFEAIGREHLEALGGTPSERGAPTIPSASSAAVSRLGRVYDDAATARAADAVEAVAHELVLVLASMSAGLAQCARSARALA